MSDSDASTEQSATPSGAATSPALPPVESFFPQPRFRPGAPIYFIHVPKCAGTTIRTTLESGFDGERVYPSGSPHAKGAYVPFGKLQGSGELLVDYDCISGHFGTLVFDLLKPQTNMFTWLREPRDRTLSAFSFFIEQRGGRNRSVYHERLKAGERRETVFMDWLRSAPAGASHYRLDIVGARAGVNYQHWIERNPDVDLNDAVISMLRRCFLIGLLEDNDRSLDILAAITGILPPQPGVRRNVGTKRGATLSLSPDEQREFDMMLDVDRQLYELVRGVYRRQLENLASTVRDNPALQFVGDRERLRRYLVDRLDSSARQTLTTWRAWQKGYVDNLDGRESLELPDGTIRKWRWTGPSPDTHLYFRLPHDRAYRLTILMNSATPPENVVGATLFVERQPVALSMHPTDKGYLLEAELSRKLLKSLPETAELRINTSRMLDESTVGTGFDTRKLGLALEQLGLEPVTLMSRWRRSGAGRLLGSSRQMARRLAGRMLRKLRS